jgi:signal transduction histidine kinase
MSARCVHALVSKPSTLWRRQSTNTFRAVADCRQAGSARRVTAAAAVLGAALAVLAVRADGSVVQANAWMTTLDIAVGLAFGVGAVAADGPPRQAGLLALVGFAWLAGSSWPAARPWHQAVLVVALVAFPRGRVRGATGWLFVVLATLVVLGFVSQIATAALFAATAGSAGLRRPGAGRTALYPTWAGACLATVLGLEWLFARHASLDPTLALVGYEVVLLGVAIGYPWAAKAEVHAGTVLADELFSQPRLPALDGLAAILGQALGDPSVEIYRWQGSCYVDDQGRHVIVPGGHGRWLDVADTTGPVAALTHQSVALEDPRTAEAVSAAVRLAVTHIRLQDEQQSRLRELEEARARIVATTDRQRLQVAAALRKEVEPALREANYDLRRALGAISDPGAASTLNAAAHALSAATTLIAGLVAGIPPAQLGGGRLAAALAALADTSPVPVVVSGGEAAAGGPSEETALFYVCSEALVNAIKHAGATRIEIAVRRVGVGLQASVSDNGCGGADPSGSGLQGLADRVAMDGRLRVSSSPAAGTSVTATVPG